MRPGVAAIARGVVELPGRAAERTELGLEDVVAIVDQHRVPHPVEDQDLATGAERDADREGEAARAGARPAEGAGVLAVRRADQHEVQLAAGDVEAAVGGLGGTAELRLLADAFKGAVPEDAARRRVVLGQRAGELVEGHVIPVGADDQVVGPPLRRGPLDVEAQRLAAQVELAQGCVRRRGRGR
ncbi:MAG: hypothetical protein IPM94_14045 [bacterium]|nr:hypothetical protein [bacterium]